MLLVGRSDDDIGFRVLERRRVFVYLSKGGISEIDEAATERGFSALEEFSSLITRYNVDRIICLGTATLRRASNGPWFVDQVKRRFGISIEIINGQREAELIFKGISLSGLGSYDTGLVVDIGGGSVEFVLVQEGSLIQSWSFDVGISVLRNNIDRVDPPSEPDHMNMRKYVNKHCS